MREVMTAKVVNLDDYRRSRVVCTETGLYFPQVYRRLARDFPPDSNIELMPGATSAVTYTLSTDEDATSSTFTAITRLDPRIDHGWVILRHHLSYHEADGYLDGRGDFNDAVAHDRILYRTIQGIFTIVHRNARPGAPDHLLAYMTKQPHPIAGLVEWSRVIDANGHEHGSDVMLAPVGGPHG